VRRREFVGSLIGTAVAWPLAVSAQQAAKVDRIAVVHPSHPVKWMSEGAYSSSFTAFFSELRRLGYIEGQNLIVERYSAEGQTAHFADLANEVVRQQPDVMPASRADSLRFICAEGRRVSRVVLCRLSPAARPRCRARIRSSRRALLILSDLFNHERVPYAFVSGLSPSRRRRGRARLQKSPRLRAAVPT
jgi:hypothetical protein